MRELFVTTLRQDIQTTLTALDAADANSVAQQLHSMAGALGAFASACWFTGFSLTSAANVRTLALIEVPFALLTSRLFFGQKTSGRQMLGMAVIVAGVAVLLNVQT